MSSNISKNQFKLPRNLKIRPRSLKDLNESLLPVTHDPSVRPEISPSNSSTIIDLRGAQLSSESRNSKKIARFFSNLSNFQRCYDEQEKSLDWDQMRKRKLEEIHRVYKDMPNNLDRNFGMLEFVKVRNISLCSGDVRMEGCRANTSISVNEGKILRVSSPIRFNKHLPGSRGSTENTPSNANRNASNLSEFPSQMVGVTMPKPQHFNLNRPRIGVDFNAQAIAESVRNKSKSGYNCYGMEVFHQAVRSLAVFKVLKVLKENPSVINKQDYRGRTGLHIAVAKKDVSIAKICLESGADPTIKMRDGKTAYDIAAISGIPDLVRLFSEHRKADLRQTGEKRKTFVSKSMNDKGSVSIRLSAMGKGIVVGKSSLFANSLEQKQNFLNSPLSSYFAG